MNELSINVRDYISDEMLQKIVEDECRIAIRNFFKSDTERKIANTMYFVAFNAVDEVFKENGRDFRAELIERMKNAIMELPSYFIFRRKDTYEPRNSPAQDILEEESRNARPLIRKRIEVAIAEYDLGWLTKAGIQDVLYDVICDRLFGSRNDGKRTDGAAT